MTRLIVNIDVDDLVRATDFYVSALGLRVGRRLGDSIVELLGAGVPIYLLEKKTGPAFPGATIERDSATGCASSSSASVATTRSSSRACARRLRR